MGFADAQMDGIQSYKARFGDDIYIINCSICGQPVHSLSYLHKYANTYKCKQCKEKIKQSEKEKSAEVNKVKADKKLEKAIKRIEIQNYGLQGYEEAIEKIKKHIYTPGWLQSTEEVMVAIELLKNKIKARHQVQMGRYKVDFLLPEEKVVLEVDGRIYHTKDKHDQELFRDNCIIANLGPTWEVIRITDDLINTKVKNLIPAIRKIKSNRELVRSQHNGQLPKNYSKEI